jgi:hypothetical protein
LADDSKGEVAFEIRALCPENQSALLTPYGTCGIKNRSFADPGSAFDEHKSATAHRGPERCHF